MKNSKYIIVGVIAFFALGLTFSAVQAADRHNHKQVVIKTDKGRIVLHSRDLEDLAKLKELKNLQIRINGPRHGKIDIDIKGLESKARRIERQANRLERKLERKLKRIDSHSIRKALRSLEDLDLDFDFDFDFDFDWN